MNEQLINVSKTSLYNKNYFNILLYKNKNKINLIGFFYLCVLGNDLILRSNSLELEKSNFLPVHPAFKLQSIQGNLGYDDIFLNDTFQFDINAHDVIVFLHIQKTGIYKNKIK